MSHRIASWLTFAAAFAALGFAYFAQYVLLLAPCELCLWERWPYRIVALLAIASSMSQPRTTRWILGLAGLVMLANVGISGLHVGVEWNWWNSPLPECNGELTPGAPLPAIPATPCDRPIYPLPGLPLSFATLDLLASGLFASALLGYAGAKRRRFIK
jgi:disulfide bond formation protein DsbB